MAPNANTFSLSERPKKPTRRTAPAFSLPIRQLKIFVSEKRAINIDYTIPATECHLATGLLGAPRHHLLACGHQIVTAAVEPCGANCKSCEPGKLTGIEFRCPARTCAMLRTKKEKENKMFMPRKGGVHQAKEYRNCWISKATGQSAAAIKNRIKEVADTEKRAVTVARTKAAKAIPAPAANRKRKVDDADMDIDNEEPGKKQKAIQGYAKRTVKYTMAVSQLKTDHEYKQQVPHSHQLYHDTEWQAKLAASKPLDAEYDGFSHQAHNVEELRQVKNGVEVERDVMLDLTDEVEEREGTYLVVDKLHCLCKTKDTSMMVECEHCEKLYHPSCIGKGKADLEEYADERVYKAQNEDILYYQDVGRFSCLGCDQKRKALVRELSWAERMDEKRRAKKAFKPMLYNGVVEAVEFYCDGCEGQSKAICYNCVVCAGFRLCMSCVKTPETTVKHQHGQEEDVEMA